MSATIAKLFTNGRSQAVRLPAQYRLDADEVFISRNENGDIVLSPRPRDWQSFLALEPLDEDLPRIRDDEPARDPFEGWQE